VPVLSGKPSNRLLGLRRHENIYFIEAVGRFTKRSGRPWQPTDRNVKHCRRGASVLGGSCRSKRDL
jgi:hypothetical protein